MRESIGKALRKTAGTGHQGGIIHTRLPGALRLANSQYVHESVSSFLRGLSRRDRNVSGLQSSWWSNDQCRINFRQLSNGRRCEVVAISLPGAMNFLNPRLQAFPLLIR